MTIEQAFEDFILACRADGLAAATVRWYRFMLASVVESFQGRELASVTLRDLRQWIVALQERPSPRNSSETVSPETVKSYKRALHRFWKWCSVEYEISNPMIGIKHPGRSKGKSDKAINQDDMMTLIHAAAAGSGVRSIRDLALLLMLADTTCRAGGLLSINVRDVDMERRSVLVVEKGDKLRRVHFTQITALAMTRWLDVRPECGFDALFLALNNKEQAIAPLTYAGLYEVLKRLARRTGIKGRFNPHSFRHAFGQKFLLSGGDLVSLSRLMGHTSIVTTADFYANFERNTLGDTHDRHSPVNELA